ncbi:MAG: DUF2188 domain-containing protein [Gemmatimonadaceae bacterium]
MRRYRKPRMSRGGGVHTVPGKIPGWINEMDGKVLSWHRTKEEAVSAGRRQAEHGRVEHTIHNRNGVISEKNSYGNDPFPPHDGE